MSSEDDIWHDHDYFLQLDFFYAHMFRSDGECDDDIVRRAYSQREIATINCQIHVIGCDVCQAFMFCQEYHYLYVEIKNVNEFLLYYSFQ